HLYFRHPELEIRRKDLAPGIDVKADGGYVVAPPSAHVSGNEYVWETTSDPDDVPLAELPAWVVERLTVPEPVSRALATVEPIRSGERNNRLTSMAGSMRRRSFSEEAIFEALISENTARCVPPLPGLEVRNIVRSICRHAPSAEPLDPMMLT